MLRATSARKMLDNERRLSHGEHSSLFLRLSFRLTCCCLWISNVRVQRSAMLRCTLWIAMRCCNSSHDQELWGWVGELTREPFLSCELDQERSTDSKKKKKKKPAQGQRFSDRSSSSVKYFDVQVITNREVEGVIFGYWLDFVWLKLKVLLWLLLFHVGEIHFDKGGFVIRVASLVHQIVLNQNNLRTMWGWEEGAKCIMSVQTTTLREALKRCSSAR